MKKISFCGNSLNDLRDFPESAKREAGYQLDKIQPGDIATDWKPILSIGHGIQEIRIRDKSGTFRIIYIAKYIETIFVLHCFQKKTQKTSKKDIDLILKRYNELLKEINQ